MVIVTEWGEFRVIDFAVKEALAKPALVNVRSIYRAEELAHRDFAFESVVTSLST